MSGAHAPQESTTDSDAQVSAFYRRVMAALQAADVPFLVGGAFAFAAFTGIRRDTKDLDLFIRRAEYARAARALRGAGYRTDVTYDHWLAKAHADDTFVDLIFNSGNGVSPVDDGWFDGAIEAEVLGLAVRIAPVEESLCTKAFIMERERYDGADVAHLLRHCAAHIDWRRLLRCFEPHWRVLLAHLVLFGFVYPGERGLVPRWLMDDLLLRLQRETADPDASGRLCAGTLLSREQYLHDIEQEGYADARIAPLGKMTAAQVAAWTRAIPGRRSAVPPAVPAVERARRALRR